MLVAQQVVCLTPKVACSNHARVKLSAGTICKIHGILTLVGSCQVSATWINWHPLVHVILFSLCGYLQGLKIRSLCERKNLIISKLNGCIVYVFRKKRLNVNISFVLEKIPQYTLKCWFHKILEACSMLGWNVSVFTFPMWWTPTPTIKNQQ